MLKSYVLSKNNNNKDIFCSSIIANITTSMQHMILTSKYVRSTRSSEKKKIKFKHLTRTFKVYSYSSMTFLNV